jgi:fibronectin type 3 domain-containing protein
MKKLLTLIFLFGMTAHARTATLAWDAPTGTDNNGTPFASYRVYESGTPGGYIFGVSPADLLATIPFGVNTYQVTNVSTTAMSYFVVTTVDAQGGESVPSNELALNALPPAPTNLRVSGR